MGSPLYRQELYEYQPDRKAEHPKKFLAGFRGYLHTNGYSGYHDLEGITMVGCWAHARRYFDEALKSLPKGKQSTSSAATGLAYCTKLFQEEARLAELPPEERYKKRLELSNNRAERSIKPFVIGRKNFLFANTPSGARSSAVIFSLIETAKEYRLDPYRYLAWVLEQAPRLSIERQDWAQLLMPANAPAQCRGT